MKNKRLLCSVFMLLFSLLLFTACDSVVPAPDDSSDAPITDSGNVIDPVDPKQSVPTETKYYRVIFTSNNDGTCAASLLIPASGTENFTAVIPERSPEGDMVTSFDMPSGFISASGIPEFVMQETFEEKIQKPFLNSIEAGDWGGIPSSGVATDNLFYQQLMYYYHKIDVSAEDLSDEETQALLEKYPWASGIVFYALSVDLSTNDIVSFHDYLDEYSDFTLQDWKNDYEQILAHVRNQDHLSEQEMNKMEWSLQRYADHFTGIQLPDNMKSIGDRAFWGCTSLKSISIPDSVTTVGEAAFYDCNNLNVYAYDNANYIGNANNPYVVLLSAKNRDISSCRVHDSAKAICSFAFLECKKVTSIELPDGITDIGSGAFSGCTELVKITIPNSVASIGRSVFYGCISLTHITIPENVTSIGSQAFGMCFNLERVIFADPNGWSIMLYPDETVGTNITVTDSAMMAMYLSSSHMFYTWYRT